MAPHRFLVMTPKRERDPAGTPDRLGAAKKPHDWSEP
jgi:hypothetical protein